MSIDVFYHHDKKSKKKDVLLERPWKCSKDVPDLFLGGPESKCYKESVALQ